MLGLTIETDRPPASTLPPGSEETVAMSALASHFAFVKPEHALRIVNESRIEPTFARLPAPSWARPALRSTSVESNVSPTVPAGGCGRWAVGPWCVLKVYE